MAIYGVVEIYKRMKISHVDGISEANKIDDNRIAHL